MLLSMSRDLRVIFIKLADRLHNIRTIEFLPRERAERIAVETRDIYAPLAHRLGMAGIKRELEDLSLKVLDPPAYQELAQRIQARRAGARALPRGGAGAARGGAQGGRRSRPRSAAGPSTSTRST